MSPVTEVQVSRLFSSLNVQKSSLDVSNKLIKIAAEPLWKPPAHIVYSGALDVVQRLIPVSLYRKFLLNI